MSFNYKITNEANERLEATREYISTTATLAGAVSATNVGYKVYVRIGRKSFGLFAGTGYFIFPATPWGSVGFIANEGIEMCKENRKNSPKQSVVKSRVSLCEAA